MASTISTINKRYTYTTNTARFFFFFTLTYSLIAILSDTFCNLIGGVRASNGLVYVLNARFNGVKFL